MRRGSNNPVAATSNRGQSNIAKQESVMARDSSGSTDSLPKMPKAPGGGGGAMPMSSPMHLPTGGAPSPFHAAAAASIAHAILGNRGMR